jgi:hypothetical protein
MGFPKMVTNKSSNCEKISVTYPPFFVKFALDHPLIWQIFRDIWRDLPRDGGLPHETATNTINMLMMKLGQL